MSISSPINHLIKPALRSKLKTKGIPNFLLRQDKNKSHQSHLWNQKTYLVDPRTHKFTTIQERFGNRLIKSVDFTLSGVVVDIGCFIGEKLWQVGDRPHLGIGVDIAVDSLAAAQKIDIYGHRFLAADMENLPFKDNSIDYVIVFDVIEHLSHPEKGFAEISRILKPGGKFLLHIPLKDNRWSMFWWKQQLFPALAQKDYDNVGHTPDHMYTSTQIKNFLRTNSFILNREIFYNAFFTHFFDRELNQLISHLYSLLFSHPSSKAAKSPTVTSTHPKTNPLRNFYADFVVPIFEFISLLDWPLSFLHIGNSYFIVATRVPSKKHRRSQ